MTNITVRNEPCCGLCSGRLALERDVVVCPGSYGPVLYTLAWVCTNCSAAFPIAIGKGGVIRPPEALYQNGRRIE